MSGYDYGWDDSEAEAGSIKTSPERLAHLAGSRQWSVQYSVAENPSSPPSALITLARKKSSIIRQAVIKNPNCPTLVKMWLQSEGYSGMTLTEFMKAAQEIP